MMARTWSTLMFALCSLAIGLSWSLERASAATIITAVGDGISGFSGDGGLASQASLSQPDGLVFDAAGNLYVADQTSNSVRKITPSGIISTIAGMGGVANYTGDGGQATAATLNAPRGIAFDRNGNLYIADTGNNAIRKIANGIISTYVGLPQVSLYQPRGLAFDASGNLYIADTGNNVIRMVTPAGVSSTFAGTGTAGYSGDGGPALQATLNSPRWLAFDGAGNLYVADTQNSVIRLITPGGIISTFAGTGVAGYGGDGGPASQATLKGPRGLAFDAAGNLYIGDQGNDAVREVTPTGVISTVAGDGTGVPGYSGDGGPATSAKLFAPGCLAFNSSGDLFISDSGNARVREVLALGPSTIMVLGEIRTFAGNGVSGYSGNGGPATAASLAQPDGLIFDSAGNLYVADQSNNTIRKITAVPGNAYSIIPAFYVSDVAGTGAAGCCGDGGPATAALLNSPHALAFDQSGNNLYFADTTNNLIRVINLPSGTINTFAGNNTAYLPMPAGLCDAGGYPGGAGYCGDGGQATAAKLSAPRGIAFDQSGDLYIADSANNVIRMVTPAGIISTVVGQWPGHTTNKPTAQDPLPNPDINPAPPGNANGSTTAATLNGPRALTFDASGNLYIADTGNNEVRIVQGSIVGTFAGMGSANDTGDHGQATSATLNGPRGVMLDPIFGNLYISDYGNRVIRQVNVQTGIITTVAGTGGVAGSSGDGGPANLATLNGPTWVAFDSMGDMFISDLNNSRVREVYGGADPMGVFNTSSGSDVSVSPVDPTSGLQPAIITFAEVTTAGQTSVTTGVSVPALPGSTTACEPALTMSVATTASVFSPITVCVTPTELGVSCSANTSLWGYGNGSWQPVPPSGGAEGQVCGVVSSLSQFQTYAVLNTALTAQTISFPAIATQIVTVPASLTATASSGLTVTFRSLSPAVCTTLNNSVNFLTTGTCLIAADQDGNSVYAAAPEVTQQFPVVAAGQTINFASIGTQSLNNSPLTVSATASSGLPVAFSSQTTAVCTVAGTAVSLLISGTCTLAADQAGNADYAAASEVLQSFAVTPKPQTINFAAIANSTLTPGSYVVPAVSASSQLPVVLSTQSGTCSVSGSIVTLVAVGTCTLQATQTGNAVYAAASAVTQSFTITVPVAGGGPAGLILTAAGDGAAGSGGNNGLATAANLSQPDGLAFDQAGNLYIADQATHTVRKVTPSGVIMAFAGTAGSAGYSGDGGQASLATLNSPRGLAFDSAGDLYIADTGNNVIRMITPAGVISSFAGGLPGNAGYAGDGGLATAAQLTAPRGLAFDAAGNLYIADSGNNVIRLVTAGSGVISTFAGGYPGTPGYNGDGSPAAFANFHSPRGLAIDGAGNLYIADTGNNVVRSVNLSSQLVGTFAGMLPGTPGYSGDGGPATMATLSGPRGLALDAAGNLYIGDQGNNAVRKVSPAGVISTIAGNGTAGYSGDDGLATVANLYAPGWVAFNAAGDLFISDLDSARVREVVGVGPSTLGVNGIIKTVAGDATAGHSGDGGPAMLASLSQPGGLAFDGSGNLYLADQQNDSVRQVTPWLAYPNIIPGDYISDVAGIGSQGYSGDGNLATAAKLNRAFGVAFDSAGNLYIADTYNNVVRKVAQSSGDISTFVSLAAGLKQPAGLVFDPAGNLYIADTGNNEIRKVTSMGTVSLYAGTGTAGAGGNNGPAVEAQLSGPYGLATDVSGNLYVADTGNNRICMINAATGIISTLSGTAGTLSAPRGVAIDISGNVYASDFGDSDVYKIAGGTASIIAGNGTAGYGGDGGLATLAVLNGPTALAFDKTGNLFISDDNNNRVREIVGAGIPAGPPNTMPGANVAVVPTDQSTGLQPATITFGSVVQSGQTTVTTGIMTPATPALMVPCTPAVTLDVSTTAVLSGPATVCVTPAELGSSCSGSPSLWHYSGGAWQQLQRPMTTPLGQVCGITTSFSPFTLLAAGVTPQTISFASIANQTLGSSPFAVIAIASSGLAVTLTSQTPGVCSVANGTITLLTGGTCSIAADQAGNATYSAAPELVQSFTVSTGTLSQTISFASIPNTSLSASPITLSATASSRLAVMFSSQSSACTVSGTVVTLVSVGTCTIAANQPGNAAYAAAPQVTQSFMVTAALLSQAISFQPIGSQPLGTAPFAVVASASSGLAVTFSSQSPSVCSISGATVTLISTGICTLTASQAGNATYAAASPVTVMFSVTAALLSQSITFPAIASRSLGASPFVPTVSASSGLAVSLLSQTASTCSASGTSVMLIAVGTCTLQATQAGNTSYAAATPVVQSFVITAGSGGGSGSDSGPTDGPLPLWALLALASALIGIASRSRSRA